MGRQFPEVIEKKQPTLQKNRRLVYLRACYPKNILRFVTARYAGSHRPFILDD